MKNKEKLKIFKEKRHLIKPISVITLLIFAQIGLLIFVYNYLSQYKPILDNIWTIVVFIMIIYFINIDRPIDYRVAWMIVITLAPFAGVMLYLLLDILPGPKQLLNRLNEIKRKNKDLLTQSNETYQKLVSHENIDYGLEKYLYNNQNYPVYENTKSKYFTSGEDYFNSLIKDLKSAKDFILLEFFIVRPGKMMNQILEILALKCSEDVDVKLMYDGTNEFYLPEGYKEYIEDLGIEVSVFSAVKPILSTYHNNRDHRKIISIDNKIAYTGGINLSDEYINEAERFGHWKDNGIRIEGEAVRSVTTMFFYLWNMNSENETDISKYLKNTQKFYSNQFVLPFDDSPNDNENVGENVIVDTLLQAKDYVYIMTPYLIPSIRLLNALTFASKKGVDIKIMMPGIPDKKIPYMVARAYYSNIIEKNIEIYEYTPGFLHSKSIVSDDIFSLVGSINLDYRSLHLNYENAIIVYGSEMANELKSDYLNTLPSCRKMDIEEYKKLNLIYRLLGKVAKLLAPLM